MCASISMPISLKISSTVFASCLLAALTVSLGGQPAAAAGANKNKPAVYRAQHLYAMDWSRSFTPPAALPHRPEYGFLDYVPPNAIRMPGYTFVPGVGILGESCDLPTSACSNEYRDVQ